MRAIFRGLRVQGRKVGKIFIVLTATVGVSLPALASGTGSYSNLGMFSGLNKANGIYFKTYAPDPDVGPGVRSLTHTRLYFSRASYHFNGVGFFSYDSRPNRRLAYQISDANGNWIYLLGQTYEPYDANGARNQVSAGMWHAGGNTWHFNWWGPNFNVGVDAGNTSAGLGPDEASVGGDGWGGCPNAYPVNYAWYWIYRHRDNGWWYYFPASNLFNWGNTPTWSVGGNVSNGGNINFGTVSCP